MASPPKTFGADPPFPPMKKLVLFIAFCCTNVGAAPPFDTAKISQITGLEGSQSRSFTYDNRGLLTSEIHPENGTTTYPQYDARGHAWQKRTIGDTAFDLNMTFDSAERLMEIDSRNPYYNSNPASQPEWRPSKLFVGVDQRLAIYLTAVSSRKEYYGTRYHRWHESARPQLFHPGR